MQVSRVIPSSPGFIPACRDCPGDCDQAFAHYRNGCQEDPARNGGRKPGTVFQWLRWPVTPAGRTRKTPENAGRTLFMLSVQGYSHTRLTQACLGERLTFSGKKEGWRVSTHETAHRGQRKPVSATAIWHHSSPPMTPKILNRLRNRL